MARAAAAPRAKTKRVEPVDMLVGQRVRTYRLGLGMSQTTLGEKVGVTFQQIQKYERGKNRIGSSRLKKVATVLGVSVGMLFGEPEPEELGQGPLSEGTSQRHVARLLKAFAGIGDNDMRLLVVKLAEGLQQRTKSEA